MYLIQRSVPGEPICYWGRMEAWIVRPPRSSFAQIGERVIPGAAMCYERWEVAFEVAEALRLKSRLFGEVIAVVHQAAA